MVPPNKRSISIEGPRVVLVMAGKKINFLVDMGTTYSVLISHTGPPSSKSCAVTGVNGKPRSHYFTGPLTCQCEQQLISCASLVVPECPTPLLERDHLSSIRAILQLGGCNTFPWLTKTDQPEEQGPIPSHIVQKVGPAVWDKEIPRMAIHAQPVRIHLRPEAAYPNKRKGGRRKDPHQRNRYQDKHGRKALGIWLENISVTIDLDG